MNNTKNDPAVGCPLERRVMPILLHGDCLDLMATIESGSIDMILCDLPYGTTACKWDTVIPFEPLWAEYKRIVKKNGAVVLFASQPFTSALVMSNPKMFKYQWLWRKSRPSNFFAAKFAPLNAHEDIVVFSSGGCNNGCTNPMVYFPQGVETIDRKAVNRNTGGKIGAEHKTSIASGSEYHQTATGYPDRELKFANDTDTEHPTQKPVALCEYLIRTYTHEGETVLDNCMGSGTTGVGCLNAGRNFIGIEKDLKYFEIARNRIMGHNAEITGSALLRSPG